MPSTGVFFMASCGAPWARTRAGRGRALAQHWPAQEPARQGQIARKRCPFEDGAPRRRHRTRQPARRHRHQGLKGVAGTAWAHAPRGAHPPSRPGMQHKAASPCARRLPGSPHIATPLHGEGHHTPKLRKHGTSAGQETSRHKKNPPGKPGGLIVRTMRRGAPHGFALLRPSVQT